MTIAINHAGEQVRVTAEDGSVLFALITGGYEPTLHLYRWRDGTQAPKWIDKTMNGYPTDLPHGAETITLNAWSEGYALVRGLRWLFAQVLGVDPSIPCSEQQAELEELDLNLSLEPRQPAQQPLQDRWTSAPQSNLSTSMPEAQKLHEKARDLFCETYALACLAVPTPLTEDQQAVAEFRVAVESASWYTIAEEAINMGHRSVCDHPDCHAVVTHVIAEDCVPAGGSDDSRGALAYYCQRHIDGVPVTSRNTVEQRARDEQGTGASTWQRLFDAYPHPLSVMTGL